MEPDIGVGGVVLLFIGQGRGFLRGCGKGCPSCMAFITYPEVVDIV